MGVPPQSQLGFLAADVLRLLRADFAARTRDVPLTPALHRLLISVDRDPGCSQVELAEWLEVTPATVGRMVDRLEKQGLVRRDSEPGDRRVSRVYIRRSPGHCSSVQRESRANTERAFRGMTPASERIARSPRPGAGEPRRRPRHWAASRTRGADRVTAEDLSQDHARRVAREVRAGSGRCCCGAAAARRRRGV